MRQLEQNWRSFSAATSDSCLTITENFEQAAARFASRLAIVTDSWQPTYEALNACANRLAHDLIGRGGQPGDRVGILMGQGAAMIAAMVATLKAGRIGVVLNSTEPIDRLRGLIEDAGPAAIIAEFDAP